LAALIADPDSPEARTALDVYVTEILDRDADLAAAVDGLLTGFFQAQFDSGDGRALADLGRLLWWDDPPRARAALERAVETGNQHALIDLGKFRHAVLQDRDAGLRTYQQAADSADPDIAGQALVEIGQMQTIYREVPAARAAFERAIGTRHPRWAPQAMIGLGTLLRRQLGDDTGAQAMFQQAIDSGDADSSACALVQLANMLERRGDISAAKTAWRRAIGSRAPTWAEVALSHLLNQLEHEGDLDAVRAAHRIAVETANPDAPHALVVLGNLLKRQGDIAGWRTAWQQAIDAGYPAADDLREILSPPAEDEDEADEDEPADLPPAFDPENMAQTGIAVLDHGLPPLPGVLSYRMAIPVAYWTASQSAVVLFLRFERQGPRRRAWATMATFSRDQGQWKADQVWAGTGWGDDDPIANPGDLRGLDGRAMVVSGGSSTESPVHGQLAAIWHGKASPAVTQIALIQDGREDRRRLDSYFGAWVVCTEQPSPFHVTGLDEHGTVLAEIMY
jgi:tetratricopeptide (TPR) repeat protein